MGDVGTQEIYEDNAKWNQKSAYEKAIEVLRVAILPQSDFSASSAKLTMRQRLAGEFYQFLSDPKSSSGMQAKQLEEDLSRRTELLEPEGKIQLKRMLSGARALAGMRHCLAGNGYWTMFPGEEVDDSKYYGRQGIDIVGVNGQGVIYMINVKARSQREDAESGKPSENVEVAAEAVKLKGGAIASILNKVAGKLEGASEEYAEHRAGFRNGHHPFASYTMTIPSGRQFIDYDGNFSQKLMVPVIEKIQGLPLTSWT